MLDVLLVVLAQTATEAPAMPQQQPPAQQTEAAAPAERVPSRTERTQRRCRTETVIGSRMPSRVCRTAAEEAALANEARRLLEDGTHMWDNQAGPGN